LRERHGRHARLLDIGCGAGFLSNALALDGFDVVGIDSSDASLAIARRHDETGSVRYDVGDALALPYPAESFDAVTAMDFLEHVEDPAAVVAEAARVLRPLGTFFFHTFNRNWLAWLIVIKGVEWFVRNTPPNMHVLRLFVKPAELGMMCANNGLKVLEIRGSAPVVWSNAFFRMLATGVVSPDFRFKNTGSMLLGYTGLAERRTEGR
jgi:2-polyprenyl-6-hydroxyphenyl methylase/3-demethylubiquinone-9 3-methyltransferase